MKKIKYIFLMAVMLMAMVLCTGCGTTKVDLNDYVTISAEGYDSMGRATYSFDTEKFLEDYGDKIKLNDEVKSAEITSENAANKLLDLCVQADLDRTGNLKNGDVVTLTWTCKDQLASEYFNCELEYSPIEYEVTELTEVKEFDPFEYLEVSFEGISPNGNIILTPNYNQPEIQYITFNANQKWDLKNGDVVTITASISGNGNSFVEKFGSVLSVDTKKYSVEGLEEVVTDQSQITEEAIQKMEKQGQDAYRAYIASYWDKPETLNDISYIGYYFLKAKDGMSSYNKNYMYLIYKVSATNPDTGKALEYYIYTRYTDLTVLPDGTCNVELSQYSMTEHTFRDDGYSYKGYESLDSLCNSEVISKIDSFEYVTNIQE